MDDRELLTRIDERTANIYKLVEKHDMHFEAVDGCINEQSSQIAVLDRESRNNRKLIIGIMAAIVAWVSLTLTVVFNHIGKT